MSTPDLSTQIKRFAGFLGILFATHFLIDLGVAVFMVWRLL